jgi:hypothetical protein
MLLREDRSQNAKYATIICKSHPRSKHASGSDRDESRLSLLHWNYEGFKRFKREIQTGSGLSKHNRSRFVYALLDFDLFVSDLKQKFALPDTNAFNTFCEANLVKQT